MVAKDIREGEVMVKVRITDYGFMASGHADYEEKGYDIVCAGVSALTQSIAISLNKYFKADVKHTKNGMVVDIDRPSDVSKILLDTLRMGLNEIEKEYPNHIQVQIKKGVF